MERMDQRKERQASEKLTDHIQEVMVMELWAEKR